MLQVLLKFLFVADGIVFLEWKERGFSWGNLVIASFYIRVVAPRRFAWFTAEVIERGPAGLAYRLKWVSGDATDARIGGGYCLVSSFASHK